MLGHPRAQQVVGALVSEAASDEELATALRHRVLGPRRAVLTRRLIADHDRLRVPIEPAVDQLLGPIFYRALLVDSPVDRELIDSVIASIVDPPATPPAAGL